MPETKQFEYRHPHWYDTWNEDRPDTAEWFGNMPNAEAILNCCACISDELLDEMHAFLNTFYLREGWVSASRQIDSDDKRILLIAIIADNLGFIEHGGSIRYSWMTDAGIRWMELAKEANDARDQADRD